jgi:hypothetical protein
MLVERDAVVYYQLLRSTLDLNLVRQSRDASRSFDIMVVCEIRNITAHAQMFNSKGGC